MTGASARGPEPGWPLMTLRSFLPRRAPISSALLMLLSASCVARTTLTGLVEPSDLLRMSRMPAAMTTARTILAAANGPRGDRMRAALALSSAGARGGYSEVLDALTVALHGRVRDASAAGDAVGSERAGRAIDLVEGAKLRASGNVNPQLVTSALIRSMSEL